MSDHQHWDELAAGFALHALTPPEEGSFVDHLAGCERCAASVDDHSLVAAQLGSLSHPTAAIEAPPWSAIRAAVTGQVTPGGGQPSPPSPPSDELARRRNRRADLARRVLAVAAGVAVLAGGGVVAWRLTNSPNRSNLTTTAAACAHASGCHAVSLIAPGTATRMGTVLVRGEKVTILPTGMPSATDDRMYVLWQVPLDGRAAPIGEFRGTGKNAPSAATIEVPYSDTLEFAVSSEPTNALLSKPSNLLAVGTPT